MSTMSTTNTSTEPFIGSGEPPVPGAVPIVTRRDNFGNLIIQFCRSSRRWMCVAVADGWGVYVEVPEDGPAVGAGQG
jgi:hypothetical protein